MTNIKVSVIIPIFRAEKFIEHCLTSLLCQTLEEIEIIAVDDKGNDQSMEIVKRLSQTHAKGSLIHIVEMPQNSGAAAARNKGFQYAQGEYVAFVDSDDWCEPTMYESLYQSAKHNEADWCYSYAVKEFENGKKEILQQISLPCGELTPTIRKKMLTHFVAYFWTSIYKKDFLAQNKIQFPLYRFSEDSYFVWMVVMHAQTFQCVPQVFYHYIVQPNSVSNTYNATKSIQKIEIFAQLLSTLQSEKRYDDYKEELDYLFIKKGALIPLCIYAIDNRHPKREEIQTLLGRILKIAPNYRDNNYFRSNWALRVLVGLFTFVPIFCCYVLNYYFRLKKVTF